MAASETEHITFHDRDIVAVTESVVARAAGNYAAVFGPYFTIKHHTPWGAAINLDDDHAEGVRAFIVDNAVRWLRDFHLDALRLDAVQALIDDSPRHVLAEMADAVASLGRELGRPLTLIAEYDLNDVTMVTPTAEGAHTDHIAGHAGAACSHGLDQSQWHALIVGGEHEQRAAHEALRQIGHLP